MVRSGCFFREKRNKKKVFKGLRGTLHIECSTGGALRYGAGIKNERHDRAKAAPWLTKSSQ